MNIAKIIHAYIIILYTKSWIQTNVDIIPEKYVFLRLLFVYSDETFVMIKENIPILHKKSIISNARRFYFYFLQHR